MPGSGKTYMAKQLSEKYSCNCVDLDEYIEQKEQQPIHEIFRTKGESYFRTVECECLKEIIIAGKDGLTIVACGGGTPAFCNNMKLMKQAGCVVYFAVDMNTLESRIKTNIKDRPLFESVDVVKPVLYQLYHLRKSYFEQADYMFNANEYSMDNFDKIIESCINKQ